MKLLLAPYVLSQQISSVEVCQNFDIVLSTSQKFVKFNIALVGFRERRSQACWRCARGLRREPEQKDS